MSKFEKLYNHIINEGFVDLENVTRDEDILRLAIQAEYDAANLYSVLAEKTNNIELENLLKHIRDEEHEHIGEFEEFLKIISPGFDFSKSVGKQEYKNH